MHAKNFLDITTEYDSGFISLSNENATKEESTVIREDLAAILMGSNYSVSTVIARNGSKMNLLFVADTFLNAGLKNVLIKCGKAFHQDSILFFPRKKRPLLINISEKMQETELPLKTLTLRDKYYLSKLEIPYLKTAQYCHDLKLFSGFSGIMRKSDAVEVGEKYGIKIKDLREEKRPRWQKNYLDISSFSVEEYQQRKKEMFVKIIDNIDLFMNNIKAIQENLSWYYTPLYNVCAGAVPIGSKHITLGQILELWKYEGWITKCSCGGKIYITYVSGSLLSGSGGASGHCDSCGIKHNRLKPVGKYVKPTLSYSTPEIPYDMKIDSLDEVIRKLRLLENS